MRRMNMDLLAVDGGGTKIRSGIINESGEILYDETVKTTYPLYETIEQVVLKIIKKYPAVQAIGIGTTGFVNAKEGKIVYSPLPGWKGTEVKKKLEEKTNLRVEVENDANCAALAEAKLGAAKGYDRILCLTIGTGLGGGIIIDGNILNSPMGGAGEIGHMILYPNGHVCLCGRKGCFEQYVSGTALKRKISEAGLTISPKELFKMGEDETASQIIESFLDDLAVIISSLQAAFDMDIVVIGGGVSESLTDWTDTLIEKTKPLLLREIEDRKSTRLNSSHVAISYAVFCLKKKKTTTQQQ